MDPKYLFVTKVYFTICVYVLCVYVSVFLGEKEEECEFLLLPKFSNLFHDVIRAKLTLDGLVLCTFRWGGVLVGVHGIFGAKLEANCSNSKCVWLPLIIIKSVSHASYCCCPPYWGGNMPHGFEVGASVCCGACGGAMVLPV